MSGSDAVQQRLPPLQSLKVFETVSRHLSFTVAGEELGLTQSAVSRQIRRLEEHLGFPLFRRLTRRIELTDAGIALLGPVQRGFHEIEEGVRHVSGAAASGTLTVSCLPTLAAQWLMPRLNRFIEQNPGLDVRLTSSIEPADFSAGGPDLAIRVGERRANAGEAGNGEEGGSAEAGASGPAIDLRMAKDWRLLRALPLMDDVLVPVCAPALLEEVGGAPDIERLLALPLLHMSTRPDAWVGWLASAGAASVVPEGRAYGHFFLAIQAAIEGRGVAMVPRILVLDELFDRVLVQAHPHAARSRGAYHLLGLASAWEDPRVARFRAWLTREARSSERLS